VSDSNSTRRRAISRAPAPIPPLQGGSWWRPRPEEEVGDHLPRAPDGLISLALAIPRLMRERATWGVTDAHAGCESAATTRLADALVNGSCRGVGIDPRSGEMVWIPLSTWRRTIPVRGSGVVSAPQAAMMRRANSVPVFFPAGSWCRLSLTVECYPFVLLNELASVFGATALPPSPSPAVLATIASLSAETPAAPGTQRVPQAEGTAPIQHKKRGRPPAYDWGRVNKWIDDYLHENGCPRRGDGGQTNIVTLVAAECFHPEAAPGRTQIEAAVSRRLELYRKQVGTPETR